MCHNVPLEPIALAKCDRSLAYSLGRICLFAVSRAAAIRSARTLSPMRRRSLSSLLATSTSKYSGWTPPVTITRQSGDSGSRSAPITAIEECSSPYRLSRASYSSLRPSFLALPAACVPDRSRPRWSSGDITHQCLGLLPLATLSARTGTSANEEVFTLPTLVFVSREPSRWSSSTGPGLIWIRRIAILWRDGTALQGMGFAIATRPTISAPPTSAQANLSSPIAGCRAYQVRQLVYFTL
jgi:hypothetical protein